MRRIVLVAIFAVMHVSLVCLADESPIVTDRPDVAESSETVGYLRFQAEFGVDVDTDVIDARRVTAMRTPLKVRFGVWHWAEVHIETDALGIVHGSGSGLPSDTRAGSGDLDVGGKIHLLDQIGPRPSVGLLSAVSLPIGADAFSEDAIVLLPTVALDWAVDNAWSVGFNVGFSLVLTERNNANDAVRYALSLGRTLAPLSDKVRSFVELFGQTPLASETTALGIDGGFCWLILPYLQLDLSIKAGLTDTAPDVGGGVGISVRI